MAKKPHISSEEKQLFLDSMKGVHPFKQDKINPAKSKKKIIKRPPVEPISADEEWHDINEYPMAKPNDPLLYRKPGIQDNIMRKLKRRQFPIQAKLDLHGMIASKAKQALYQFIEQAYAMHCRCVLVVHGKGYSAKNEYPILKNNVNHWLRQSPHVVAFCSAQDNEGGTGALYVLIKINSD